MVKKIVVFTLTAILVFVLAACGNNEASQQSEKSVTESRQNSSVENVENKTKNDDETEAFSETLTFMGYTFNYPESLYLDHYMYGHTFHNADIFLLLEAPSIAGVLLDVDDINNTATICEEYVIKTLETSVRSLFNFDDTTQTITNSEVKTINDIEMLRVEGFFTNTRQDTEIPFVGYYFLADAYPTYFVGISINEEGTVDTFIDEFAGCVEDTLK